MKLRIRARLALTFTAILLVVIATLEIGGYVAVRAAVLNVVDRELNTRLGGVEDHIARHVARLGWPKTAGDLAVHPAFQPSLLVIRSGNGDVLMEGSAMAGLPTTVAEGFVTVDGRTDSLRLLSVRHTIHGEVYSLVLGTDLQVQSGLLHYLWLLMLLSMPLVLAMSAGAAYWMSGRALAPIQEMISAARSIDSQRLSQRVPVPHTGDEVQQLAETFNGMLERIEMGFQKMRDFIANASHELRTPVSIVRAAAEIALLHPRPTEASYREALERVLRESERNTLLLENMLELARADSGTDTAQCDWISLNHSLEETCGQVLPLAASKNISLHVNSSGAEPEILADHDQLRRLWLILLDNAIKYTSAGGTVKAAVYMDSQGRAIGEILDTGIGLTKEQAAFIFERFYRADKSRSRAMGGTGLGLSIAREIASIHEADIQVRSNPNVGSRFIVSFPSSRSRPVAHSANADPADRQVVLR